VDAALEVGASVGGTHLPAPDVALVTVQRRRVSQWLGAVVVVVLFVLTVASIAHNKNIEWGVVRTYLSARSVLDGLRLTVELTVLSMIVAVAFGTVVAVCRLSPNPVLSWLSWFWTWFFRGVPLIVQLLIWGNFAILFKHIDIGVPFTHLIAARFGTNVVITTFVASILGLGLSESAYMAEIMRAGILSVEAAQSDAARSLGMTTRQLMRLVILPQAMRVIVPPTGNEFINLLKASSLVSVIAGGELLTAVENISSVNYRVVELLIVATFWYLVIVSIASVSQHFLERRLGRSQA